MRHRSVKETVGPATLLPTRFHPDGEAFVPGTESDPRPTLLFGGIPGELAQAEILGGGQHQRYGRWRSADAPSSDRVPVPCRHDLPCGGCPWEHLRPEAGRLARQQLVEEALREEGISAVVEPVVPGPDGEAGFRHNLKLVADEGGVLGVFGRHSHTVARIPECRVIAPALRPLLHLPPFPVPGILRGLVARSSRSSGQVIATVVARKEHPLLADWARALPVQGVSLNLHSRVGDTIFDYANGFRRLWGAKWIEETVGDQRIRIGPGDFFQTNPGTAGVLWSQLPRPTGPLLDLYCGVGAVSLTIGGTATRILGIEEGEAAVRRAQENALLNGRNAEYRTSRVSQAEIPEDFAGGMVVVNPPRKGLETGVVEKILSLRPQPLVYISCHPLALARDLRLLVAGGLSIRRIRPYDMFPNTPHVETVAILD